MTSNASTGVDGPAVTRSAIAPSHRNAKLVLPLALLILNASLYAATLIGAIATPWWGLKALLLVINGISISTLFLIGHDACHNCFTRWNWLNALIGRVSLFPSLVPCTTWRYNHNYLHHGFTNCADRDYVWRPLSLAEYRGLSPVGRFLERAYRTIPGLPLNWIITNWWTKKLFPRREPRRTIRKWGSLNFDRTVLALWLVGLIAGVLTMQWGFHGLENSLEVGVLLFIYLVLPFLVWSTMISYVVFLQHTHPAIPWFTSYRNSTYFRRQVESTVHVVYPFPVGILFHNIMEHTAHHADPSIPMYHLRKAQAELERSYPERIKIVFYSVGYLYRTLRTCKLYDYVRHQWTDFEGRPTAPAIAHSVVELPAEPVAPDTEARETPSTESALVLAR